MSDIIIFKSSAGSGKTYTLVKEYLLLLLPEPRNYKHILAITFTNKATEEMKSRIIQTLTRLATWDDTRLQGEPFFQDLSQAFAGRSQTLDSIPNQAKLALSYILSDYANFSIFTIESFFQKILRGFSRELNIPFGYEIEMKHDLVFNTIYGDILLEIRENPSLSRLLLEYLESNLDQEKGWDIRHAIERLGSELFKEKFQQAYSNYRFEENHTELTLQLARNIQAYRKEFESSVYTLALEGLALIDTAGLQISDFYHRDKGPAGYLAKIKHQMEAPKSLEAPHSYARKVAESTDYSAWYSKTTKPALRAQIEAVAHKGLHVLMKKIVDTFDSSFPTYQALIQLSRTIYSFGLIYDLRKKLMEYRKENNQLIISDTASLLNLVVKGTDTPFIYERVSNWYKYYLIDEFQDTSDLQWDNIFPLIADSAARGYNNLIVGDVKQSIYRWRNGNMQLLMYQVQDDLKEKLGISAEVRLLSNNWRSAPEIVQFNNAFFTVGVSLLKGQFEPPYTALWDSAYEHISQDVQRKDKLGYVSVSFIPVNESSDAEEEIVDWKVQSMSRTLDIIQQLLSTGVAGGDIVLLVRKNFDGVLLANFLQSEGIKVISSESLLLAYNPAIILTAALLEFLVDNTNQISLAKIQYYYRLLHTETEVGHDDWLEAPAGSSLALFFDQIPSLRRLPVYECIERIMGMFSALQQADAYTLGFLSAALEYSRRYDGNISGFLAWWTEQKDKLAISTSPDPGAVQIITIHKAKGLEFPIVIMPFAEWQLVPDQRDLLWLDPPELEALQQVPYLPVFVSSKLDQSVYKEEYRKEHLLTYLDNVNLLYVAFTRAIDRLYAIAPLPKAAGKDPSIRKLSELLWDTVSGLEVGSFDADTLSYTFGHTDLAQQAVKKAEPLLLDYRKRADTNWMPALRLRKEAPPYLQDEINLGLLCHEALGLIKTFDDLPQAVEKMVLKGAISVSEKETFTEKMRETLFHHTASSWYTGDWIVKNEAEILGGSGRIFRPDRVMIKGDTAVVVDYKSGVKNPEHIGQVQDYIALLQTMGYPQVKGYLYYLGREVVEV